MEGNGQRESAAMTKFKKGESVSTKYGTGKVMFEDEDSMTVVVRYLDGTEHALPRFQVRKIKE